MQKIRLAGEDICSTLTVGDFEKSRYNNESLNKLVLVQIEETNMDDNIEYIVRRLTPDECCRLQGMPDGWCNIGDWTDTKGKKHKDSDAPKYKAFGNGMALPNAIFVMEGIVKLNELKEILS